LEKCCDHIRVYNGPSSQSGFLGEVITDQKTFFNSTSRYMTIVFSTDHSVTHEG
ncbi:deleted in malignant brain tumors 1 protein-like, partial [Clarias magur]